MAREIVGLKVGASGLSAARVATNGSARLLQVAAGPLPGGIVAGGEVRDPDGLATALGAFFKEHGLPTRAVRVGVANNRVGVRTIDVDGVEDPKQLANAVRFRAQEALPIPLNEAVLDYQVLSEEPGEGGATARRVLFVVAYRDLVDGYAQACKQAGLRLVGVDLEAFALLRALTPFGERRDAGADGSALVAVALGSERSTLGVSDGFTCEFTRVIDWGGAELTSAIARELGLETEDAERLKRVLALDGDDVPEGIAAEDAARARAAMLHVLRGFARELVSSLQFYQGQPGSLDLREIVLAGGTSQLVGLAPALEQMIAVSVRVGDPTVNLDPARKVKGGEPNASLAVSIGLGMGL
ncbi:MAG: type IV pilus assembly protein PilM [Thermoleophilia bacterium]|nr:type IV pilus assembly protein PilM [Thermoleophilia bacterium]